MFFVCVVQDNPLLSSCPFPYWLICGCPGRWTLYLSVKFPMHYLLVDFISYFGAQEGEHCPRTSKGVSGANCVCAWLVTQSCPTLRPHGLQPARLLCPWDSPGKSTGAGCHFLEIFQVNCGLSSFHSTSVTAFCPTLQLPYYSKCFY